MSSDNITTYSFEYKVRPWTTNAERNWHHMKRHKHVKEWREAFSWLAKGKPALKWATITIEPWQKNGVLADVAACNPAAKAAIDGIVDAGILKDDSPRYLHSVTFLQPQKGRDGMVVWVRGVPLTADELTAVEYESRKDNT